jgi:hypothetical protein
MVVDDYGHYPSEVATPGHGEEHGRKRVSCVPAVPVLRNQAPKEEFTRLTMIWRLSLMCMLRMRSRFPGVSGQTIVDENVREGHDTASFQPDQRRSRRDRPRLNRATSSANPGVCNIHEAASILARDIKQPDELQTVMGSGTIKPGEPMAAHHHAGWRSRAVLAEPDRGSLARLSFTLPKPAFVVGRGSNLLVRDGGIRGVAASRAR